MAGASPPPVHRRPGFRLGILLGAGIPVLLLAVLSFVGPDGTDEPTAGVSEAAHQRQQFEAFEQALRPLADEGASVVFYGMHPGVTDIAEGRFPPETLEHMAAGWVGTMERIRSDVAALHPPPRLEAAAALYLQALDTYVLTAQVLLEAARADAAAREELMSQVPTLGRRADELWDEAESELERQRSAVGARPRQDRSDAPVGSA